jgi:hypothetical protein
MLVSLFIPRPQGSPQKRPLRKTGWKFSRRMTWLKVLNFRENIKNSNYLHNTHVPDSSNSIHIHSSLHLQEVGALISFPSFVCVCVCVCVCMCV